MRWLFVSPHLDDAIMSCGAFIVDLLHRGDKVEVVTVFAGDAPDRLSQAAANFQQDCGVAGDLVSLRREEDRRAFGTLGDVSVQHLPFIDAIYRREDDGTWLIADDDAELFNVTSIDTALMEQIKFSLREFILRADHVATCEGIGGHVDHRLTRAAVEESRTELKHLYLWQDLPYSKATQAVRRITPEERASYAAKVRLVECYSTQLKMLGMQAEEFATACYRESLVEVSFKEPKRSGAMT